MEKKWILLWFTIERIGNEERLGTQPILAFMARFRVSPQFLNGEFHRVVTFPSERLKNGLSQTEMTHLLMKFLVLWFYPVQSCSYLFTDKLMRLNHIYHGSITNILI